VCPNGARPAWVLEIENPDDPRGQLIFLPQNPSVSPATPRGRIVPKQPPVEKTGEDPA